MITSIKFGAVAALALTSAVATAGSAVAAEARLTAIASLQQTNPLTKSFLANFVKALNEKGKGTVVVRFVGGPEVVPPPNGGDAIAKGQFDILHGPASYYIGTFPEAYAMLASNVAIAELHKNGGFAMLDGLYQKKMNAKLIAWGESDLGYNTYLVAPPKLRADGLPDLTNMKMRASGTYRPLFEALGAVTVNMKESEIYTGLQRGLVQGFGWPVTGVPALGLHKLVKVRVMPAFYKTNTVVVMNLAKWNALTQEQKQAIESHSRLYEQISVAFMAKEAAADEVSLRQGGVKDLVLEGAAGQKYLKTAFEALWIEYKKLSKGDDGEALRAKLYRVE